MPKVILSRKGFDATAGGAPSPIMPGGRLVSLPIPEAGTGARYAQLRTPAGESFADVMAAGGITTLRAGRHRVPLDARSEAHLDPDLVAGARDRPAGWRPAFGQAGAAQTVLANAGVGVGDLFLFFGWFRPIPVAAGELGLEPRRDLHVIWGWLRVGEVVAVGADSPHPGQEDHPHVVLPDRVNNTLYVADDEAFPSVPGAGVLGYSEAAVLTAPDAPRRADWLLPACLHPSQTQVLPRHAVRFSLPRDGCARFDARFQWQEFVAEANGDVAAWATEVIGAGTAQ